MMLKFGDFATPGTPFLTLEKDGVFCVSLVVPEKHIQSVSLGQKVNVTIPSMQDMTVQGTVGRIDPAADLKSRSFTVKVALPDEQKFRTGNFERVAIPVGEAGMIVIPEKAVVERGQLKGFDLVDENNIAHFRLLRTGRVLGDSVEVLSGLKNNDPNYNRPKSKKTTDHQYTNLYNPHVLWRTFKRSPNCIGQRERSYKNRHVFR